MQVNDIINRALGSAQVSSTRELLGMSREDGKQPDGQTLVPWKEGMCMTWDYTCRDTLALSNVDLCTESAGKAAERAEKDKISKYAGLTNEFIFIPVANETFGAWAPDSLKFIVEVGSRITAINGDKNSTYYLFQRISMATQRGNIISIKGCLKNPKTLHELSYL